MIRAGVKIWIACHPIKTNLRKKLIFYTILELKLDFHIKKRGKFILDLYFKLSKLRPTYSEKNQMQKE